MNQTDDKRLPSLILDIIQQGPTGDERLNDEWKRRELFATRVAMLAYTAGLTEGGAAAVREQTFARPSIEPSGATPRTDAAERESVWAVYKLARQLERELASCESREAAAVKAAMELGRELSAMTLRVQAADRTANEALRSLPSATVPQPDELRAALTEYESALDASIKHGDITDDDLLHDARNALMKLMRRALGVAVDGGTNLKG